MHHHTVMVENHGTVLHGMYQTGQGTKNLHRCLLLVVVFFGSSAFSFSLLFFFSLCSFWLPCVLFCSPSASNFSAFGHAAASDFFCLLTGILVLPFRSTNFGQHMVEKFSFKVLVIASLAQTVFWPQCCEALQVACTPLHRGSSLSGIEDQARAEDIAS